VVEAGTHQVALASTRRCSFAAAALWRWHASPAWPCSSRGGRGGELHAETGRREDGTRGGGRHQEQEKARANLGARLQRASTGGSVHAVKALGRGAGSARAARGVREEEEWRLVVRFGRLRKKKGKGMGERDDRRKEEGEV
jgi:hypothetical protein